MAGLHHNPVRELPPLQEGWEGLGAAGHRFEDTICSRASQGDAASEGHRGHMWAAVMTPGAELTQVMRYVLLICCLSDRVRFPDKVADGVKLWCLLWEAFDPGSDRSGGPAVVLMFQLLTTAPSHLRLLLFRLFGLRC